MQLCPFINGGYALHRIQIGSGRYSAWFDRTGAMVDCERTYPQRRDVPARQRIVRSELERLGKRYQHVPVL